MREWDRHSLVDVVNHVVDHEFGKQYACGEKHEVQPKQDPEHFVSAYLFEFYF